MAFEETVARARRLAELEADQLGREQQSAADWSALIERARALGAPIPSAALDPWSRAIEARSQALDARTTALDVLTITLSDWRDRLEHLEAEQRALAGLRARLLRSLSAEIGELSPTELSRAISRALGLRANTGPLDQLMSGDHPAPDVEQEALLLGAWADDDEPEPDEPEPDEPEPDEPEPDEPEPDEPETSAEPDAAAAAPEPSRPLRSPSNGARPRSAIRSRPIPSRLSNPRSAPVATPAFAPTEPPAAVRQSPPPAAAGSTERAGVISAERAAGFHRVDATPAQIAAAFRAGAATPAAAARPSGEARGLSTEISLDVSVDEASIDDLDAPGFAPASDRAAPGDAARVSMPSASAESRVANTADARSMTSLPPTGEHPVDRARAIDDEARRGTRTVEEAQIDDFDESIAWGADSKTDGELILDFSDNVDQIDDDLVAWLGPLGEDTPSVDLMGESVEAIVEPLDDDDDLLLAEAAGLEAEVAMLVRRRRRRGPGPTTEIVPIEDPFSAFGFDDLDSSELADELEQASMASDNQAHEPRPSESDEAAAAGMVADPFAESSPAGGFPEEQTRPPEGPPPPTPSGPPADPAPSSEQGAPARLAVGDARLPGLDVSEIGLADAERPILDLPDIDIDLPDIDLSDIDLSDIDQPDIDLPDIDLAGVEQPDEITDDSFNERLDGVDLEAVFGPGARAAVSGPFSVDLDLATIEPDDLGQLEASLDAAFSDPAHGDARPLSSAPAQRSHEAFVAHDHHTRQSTPSALAADGDDPTIEAAPVVLPIDLAPVELPVSAPASVGSADAAVDGRPGAGPGTHEVSASDVPSGGSLSEAPLLSLDDADFDLDEGLFEYDASSVDLAEISMVEVDESAGPPVPPAPPAASRASDSFEARPSRPPVPDLEAGPGDDGGGPFANLSFELSQTLEPAQIDDHATSRGSTPSTARGATARPLGVEPSATDVPSALDSLETSIDGLPSSPPIDVADASIELDAILAGWTSGFGAGRGSDPSPTPTPADSGEREARAAAWREATTGAYDALLAGLYDPRQADERSQASRSFARLAQAPAEASKDPWADLDIPDLRDEQALPALLPSIERERRRGAPSPERRALPTRDGPARDEPPDDQAPRAPLGVRVGLEAGEQFFTGFSADISVDGIMIETHHRLGVGRRVDLFFELPGGYAVNVDGRVRRIRTEGRGREKRVTGLAVRFSNLSREDRVRIGRYVARTLTGKIPGP